MRKVEIPGGRYQLDTIRDPGSAPILQWLRIEDLVVDDGYQRDLKPGNWKAIRKIAENFTWSRFSPVFVAPVEGGKFAIIDGQHRVHAALICGHREVPCQIVQMTRAEQAQAFAAVNGMVTKVTTWNLLKAELASGLESSVRLRELVVQAGCTLALSNPSTADKRPGVIYAVGSLKRLFEQHGENLGRALKIIRSADGYNDVVELWAGNILIPLLGALLQRPKAIARPDFQGKFELFPIWEEIDGIEKKAADRRSKGLPTISKKELLEVTLLNWIDENFPERVMVAAQ